MRNNHIKIVLTTIFIFCFVISGKCYDPRKTLILTSTTDIAAICKKIAADHVAVVSVMDGGANPSFIEPNRIAVLKAKKADFFLKIGLDLETRWETLFYKEANNSNIAQGALGNIVISSGIELLPIKSVDGKTKPVIHKKGNPYFWLNPLKGKKLASNIFDFLVSVDPANKPTYKKNLNAFNKEIDEKIDVWKKDLQPVSKVPMVAFQHNFDYLADFFGLNIVDYIEPASGVPPTPARIKDIIQKIKTQQIKIILIADYNSKRIPEKIAKESGATLVVMPASVGSEWIEDYIQLFNYITNRLPIAVSKALKKE